MAENKRPTNFMERYQKIIENIKQGSIIRRQYVGNNDSVIYLGQQTPISVEENNNLIKKINQN
jgi:hypothetical protein